MNLEYSVSLAPFSTFRIGGKADILSYIATKQDLKESVQMVKEKNLRFLPVGGGSNLLFADEGFRGCVLLFKNEGILCDPLTKHVSVEAGVKNAALYQWAKKENLDFAVFTTIPGTVGGAIFGNAGIPGTEIGDFLISATLFNTETLEFEDVDHDFFQFSYRHSIFHEAHIQKKYLLWSAKFVLPTLSEVEITAKAKDLMAKRKEKQPWGLTGGSFFKNPPEGAAGYFLDQVGAKSMRIGDAFFSEKHANFVMNAGNATQHDVLDLTKKGANAVKERFGIDLIREVRALDEYGALIL